MQLDKILILAGDTDGNLGDSAIMTATCDALRNIMPKVSITIQSSRPNRDRETAGVSPIPRGWHGIPKLARAARQADLVICGGGGLFQDDDSLLKMPYWAVRLVFLRILNRQMIGFSIGAGPLNYRISRLFATLALKTLRSVSVRDAIAQSLLQPMVETPIDVVPDPAFLLEGASADLARRALREVDVPLDGRPLVGVAVRRLFHASSNLLPHKYAHRLGLGRGRGEREMAALIIDLALVMDEVVSRTNGHVIFMPTYNAPHEDDAEICKAVAAKMRSGRHSLLLLDDPKLYKAVSGLVTVMFCGRMHAAILAAGSSTPIVGFAYNSKFQGTFDMLGQHDRCLSAYDFAKNRQSKQAIAMLVEAIESPSQFRPDTARLAEATRRHIDEFLTALDTE